MALVTLPNGDAINFDPPIGEDASVQELRRRVALELGVPTVALVCGNEILMDHESIGIAMGESIQAIATENWEDALHKLLMRDGIDLFERVGIASCSDGLFYAAVPEGVGTALLQDRDNRDKEAAILRDVVSGAEGLSLCFDGTKYMVVNNDPEFKMGEMTYTAVKALQLGGNSGVMAVSTGANIVVGFHKVHQIARGDSFCTQGAGFGALTAFAEHMVRAGL